MKMTRTDMLLGSIRRLLRREATAHIKRLLLKSHPSEIAAVVRQLNDDDAVLVIGYIKGMENEPETFVELEGAFLQTFLNHTEDFDHVAHVLSQLPEDEVAALIEMLEDEHKEKLLSLMKTAIKDEVNTILQYGEDSCGRIMAVNVFYLSQDFSADEAIKAVRESDNVESLFYIYVTDDYENLAGVVSLRQLLQAGRHLKLKDFMTRDVVRVTVDDTQERAAHLVEEYNYVSLPVTDQHGRLLGMVTVDDVLDYIRVEAEEEALLMAGIEAEAIDDFSFWRAFASRSIWFGLLLLGGILSAEIIVQFWPQTTLATIAFCFAPLVLRLGGSVSTQTITFVQQGILERDIERSRALRAFWSQNAVTLLMTFLVSALVFAYATWRFEEHFEIALALGLSLFCVALLSLVLGVIMPIAFEKLKLESVKASSRFVHFLMDAISLVVFFRFLMFWTNSPSFVTFMTGW